MVIKNENFDTGKAFDWGRTSGDYAAMAVLSPRSTSNLFIAVPGPILLPSEMRLPVVFVLPGCSYGEEAGKSPRIFELIGRRRG